MQQLRISMLYTPVPGESSVISSCKSHFRRLLCFLAFDDSLILFPFKPYFLSIYTAPVPPSPTPPSPPSTNPLSPTVPNPPTPVQDVPSSNPLPPVPPSIPPVEAFGSCHSKVRESTCGISRDRTSRVGLGRVCRVSI